MLSAGFEEGEMDACQGNSGGGAWSVSSMASGTWRESQAGDTDAQTRENMACMQKYAILCTGSKTK